MIIHFLGTAAFEGIPSLFCKCGTCQEARRRGGKDIRTRTSVLIDEVLKVDFPPDTCHQAIRDDLDMDKVRDLILTHSHSDHLYAEDLVIRLPGYAQAGDHIINIYGHDLPIRQCMQQLGSDGQQKFKLQVVHPFAPVSLQTAVITPLPATHDRSETCLIYYIERDGKNILYGHDSGWFPDATWDWLKGCKLDLAILECTVGHSPHRSNHMNIDAVLETRQWMIEHGVLKPGGKIAVTHFSHNGHLLHGDLEAIFTPHQIIVAYDGMKLEL